jgi:hypothetical protein
VAGSSPDVAESRTVLEVCGLAAVLRVTTIVNRTVVPGASTPL